MGAKVGGVSKRKERLDKLMVLRGLVNSRSRGQTLVMAGEVRVNGERAVKSSMIVGIDAKIELIAPMPYVSRGGKKLAAALTVFDIVVREKICADVGACTGGFTDVLLQQGARRVYAIDVGYGQLDWKLRQDPRVVVMERTNARHLGSLPQKVNFVSVDVSFISLRLILPSVLKWLDADADVVILIKPQFEAGRRYVGKGGIVRDPAVHRQVLADILGWSEENGFTPMGLIRSPITGADGNVEFLAWLSPESEPGLNVDTAIQDVTD
jgi:23S rRNA (cytidine1920-2'-O)/16S rRNA (cytidine1409-2'-O)-methyltransferase